MTLTRREVLLAAGTTAIAAGAVAGSSEGADAATAAPAAEAPPAAFPLTLPQIPIRDPWIVADRASELYHLFLRNDAALSGTAGIGTMVARSRDLVHWSTPQAVFVVPEGAWAGHGAWAPEVHRWKGRWILLVTLFDESAPLPLPSAGASGIPVQLAQFRRGTMVASSSSLLGPFTLLDPGRPLPPPTFMTLDGTLFEDEHGKPWLVYAHEWVQKIDGTMEAVRLKDDLSGPVGHPIHLFKGSDATWISREMPAPSANQILPYVTDGPELVRLPGGALAMLWSTYAKDITNPNGLVTGHYVQTLAVSESGRLHGPWTQHDPLLRGDAGHGMVFRTLPAKGHRSKPMLVVHRPGKHGTRAQLHEIELQRHGMRLGKHRKDLDGS